MPLPDAYTKFNAEAVEKSRNLFARASALSDDARHLSDTVWAVSFSSEAKRKRAALRKESNSLSRDLVSIDSEILDFYRVPPDPNIGPNIDPQFFVIQMSLRESIRETVLRHIREASQTLTDVQIRAMTRATLVVSVFVLFVTVATLIYDATRKEATSAIPKTPGIWI